MLKEHLVGLFLILVWTAGFTPFGSSVYHPTAIDVEQLGGERSTLEDPPEPAPAPTPEPDDEA
jgi:hypothetical protein